MRTYVLELKVTICCLGKDFKFKIQWSNVTLYSARMVNILEQGPRSIDVETENVPGEPLPPAYGEGTGIGGDREVPPQCIRLMGDNS
jgi:hypothetical protein